MGRNVWREDDILLVSWLRWVKGSGQLGSWIFSRSFQLPVSFHLLPWVVRCALSRKTATRCAFPQTTGPPFSQPPGDLATENKCPYFAVYMAHVFARVCEGKLGCALYMGGVHVFSIKVAPD